MCFIRYRSVILWYTFMVSLDAARSNAITNAQFNASVRDYTAQDSTNTSEVRTLQKEYERYGSVSPISPHIRFKDVPDNAYSPTSDHSRGLHQLGHQGYGYVEYEENPFLGHEYNLQEDHGHFEGYHHLGHHHFHHNDHKHGYGHHHKHYDHALAAKSVIWPIAGIALLGAAAALVSNPILLQLGVVSGRRRRRQAEDVADKLPHIRKPAVKFIEKHAINSRNNFNIDDKAIAINSRRKKVINNNFETGPLFNELLKNDRRRSKWLKPVKTTIKTKEHLESDSGPDEMQYIPIPLQIKD